MIGARIESLSWDAIEQGMALPDLVLPITYLRAASHPAGTRDYFPGHHDPAYARAQGQPDLYVNTMFLHGVLDRLVLDWAGPAWFIARRRMAMVGSVYVNQTLTTSGIVTAKAQNDAGVRSVTIGIRAVTENRLCVTGETRIVVPRG